MSPNTGECILNSPQEVIGYDHFSLWSKNGVMKKKVKNDGEHSGVSVFSGVYILPISPKLILCYFIDLHTTLLKLSRLTPLEEVTGVRSGVPIDTTP